MDKELLELISRLIDAKIEDSACDSGDSQSGMMSYYAENAITKYIEEKETDTSLQPLTYEETKMMKKDIADGATIEEIPLTKEDIAEGRTFKWRTKNE